MAEDPPSLFLGLSDVCLRGLKCAKRVSFKKRGGIVLEKKRGCGGSVQEKKRGLGGSQNEKKEGGSDFQWEGEGISLPLTFLME